MSSLWVQTEEDGGSLFPANVIHAQSSLGPKREATRECSFSIENRRDAPYLVFGCQAVDSCVLTPPLLAASWPLLMSRDAVGQCPDF